MLAMERPAVVWGPSRDDMSVIRFQISMHAPMVSVATVHAALIRQRPYGTLLASATLAILATLF